MIASSDSYNNKLIEYSVEQTNGDDNGKDQRTRSRPQWLKAASYVQRLYKRGPFCSSIPFFSKTPKRKA